MELRHLRYFVAVAEELNFTRAAERLHIAQPPLSTQIRLLEEELGAPLFERDKRRVHLTQAGKELLDRARSVLASAEALKGVARDASSGRMGRLALGYTASAMFTQRLPLALRRFASMHPKVRLSLYEMTSLAQLEALQSHALDVGLLRKPDVELPDEVSIEPWHRAPLIAVLPHDHPLAVQLELEVADLRDQPFISYPRDAGIGLYWPVLRMCARAGFKPEIVKETREASVMIGLVAAGLGVAVVPADMRVIQLKGVVYRPLRGSDAASVLSLSYRHADDNPHLALLLQVLREPAS